MAAIRQAEPQREPEPEPEAEEAEEEAGDSKPKEPGVSDYSSVYLGIK
jgi:hypothetical protein